MPMKVKPIPDGYHSLTPYLIIQGASDAIAFYKAAFGATETARHVVDGGRIMHAEIRVGDSPIMLADEAPEMNARSPKSFGGSPVSLMLYVEDVDASFDRAVDAGAKVLRPVANMDHGDRMGGVEDPFGYSWWLASRVEDVSPEELKARSEAKLSKASA
jgi:PhnB protein